MKMTSRMMLYETETKKSIQYAHKLDFLTSVSMIAEAKNIFRGDRLK